MAGGLWSNLVWWKASRTIVRPKSGPGWLRSSYRCPYGRSVDLMLSWWKQRVKKARTRPVWDSFFLGVLKWQVLFFLCKSGLPNFLVAGLWWCLRCSFDCRWHRWHQRPCWKRTGWEGACFEEIEAQTQGQSQSSAIPIDDEAWSIPSEDEVQIVSNKAQKTGDKTSASAAAKEARAAEKLPCALAWMDSSRSRPSSQMMKLKMKCEQLWLRHVTTSRNGRNVPCPNFNFRVGLISWVSPLRSF